MKRNYCTLQFSLITFFVLLILIAATKNNRLHTKELVIFDLKHSTAIAVINGNDHLVLADTALLKRQGDIDFHVDPFLEERGVEEEKVFPLEETASISNAMLHAGNGWMQVAGKRIVIAGRAFDLSFAVSGCDILLMRSNSSVRLDSLLRKMKPKLVVADGSDGKRKTEKWKACCLEMHVPFYDVKENGALIVREQ